MSKPDPTVFPFTPTFPSGSPAQWTTPLSAQLLNSEIWGSGPYPPLLLPRTAKACLLHSSLLFCSLHHLHCFCVDLVPPAFRVLAIAFCLAVPIPFFLFHRLHFHTKLLKRRICYHLPTQDKIETFALPFSQLMSYTLPNYLNLSKCVRFLLRLCLHTATSAWNPASHLSFPKVAPSIHFKLPS